MRRLKKFTLRLDPADVEVLKTAYPDRGYTQAIRAAVHTLAKKIEQKLAGDGAP